MATGLPHKNIGLRIAQHAVAASKERALTLARRFVSTKIKNCRTLLRRNAEPLAPRVLEELRRLAEAAERATEASTLLGLEGAAARVYFESFGAMLRPPETSLARFDFEQRSRRPPRDAINALLSFVYALLVRDLTVICATVGLDPYLGLYHRPRYGRPALALDLMEEFRPLIADSVVLQLVNTGAIRAGHFVARSVGVALTPAGRVKVLEQYERRMEELVTHPVFGYRVSYRRILEVQARLLGRTLMGELRELPPFLTR
jgi:CRISPR-associated protein Cas1